MKGVTSLMLGAGSAKLVGLISLPLITRIYSVEDIGVLALINSFVMLAAPILTLRYAIAIPLPRSDSFAAYVAIASLLLAIGISSLLFLSSLFIPTEAIKNTQIQTVASFLWIVPLIALGMAVHEVFSMWLIRKKQYITVARIQIAQAALGDGTKISLGFSGWQPEGLLIGQLLFQLAGAALAIAAFINSFPMRFSRIRPRLIGSALWKYRSFPAYRLPAQILLMYSMQAPLLLSAWIYAPSAAGLLGLAIMALSLPFTFVGQAVGRVYYAEISRLGQTQPKEIQQLTFYFTKRLLLFSVPVAIVTYYMGEVLFEIVFGSQWAPAGRLASTMSVYLAFQFSASPLLHIFNVYESQNKYLIIHLQRALITTAAFLISYIGGFNLQTAILIYSTSLSLHYILTSAQIHIFLRQKCSGSEVIA